MPSRQSRIGQGAIGDIAVRASVTIVDDDSKSGNAPGTKFKRHEVSVVKEYAVFAAVFRQREVASHLLSNLLVLRIVEPVGKLLVDAAR